MVKVVTHDGHFHADEVFAIAILKKVYDEVEVIRTRNPEVFKTVDIRVDVGFRNDSETNDFDHHQKEGAGLRENGLPYASAGLVWKHFGRKLVNSDEAFEYVDNRLLCPIDAGDNGVSTFEPIVASPYIISDVIESYNPNWNDDRDSHESFNEAIDFASSLLGRLITKANGFLEANEIVAKAQKLEDGKVIVIEVGVPWQKSVLELGGVEFVVLPDSRDGWYVYTVPVKFKSFTRVKYLPKEWSALKDDELAKVTGVEDAYFCHRDLFIAAAKSKEGAISLAKLAVKFGGGKD